MSGDRAFAAALAILCVGCGGAQDRAPEPRPDPAREYRAALGQQCVNARFDRGAVPPPAGSSARDLAAYLEGNLRVARASARAAEALKPPPALVADHLRARRLAREGIALVARAARRARGGADPDGVLRRLEPALDVRIEEGNAIALRIGLPQCRQSPLDLTSGRTSTEAG